MNMAGEMNSAHMKIGHDVTEEPHTRTNFNYNIQPRLVKPSKLSNNQPIGHMSSHINM